MPSVTRISKSPSARRGGLIFVLAAAALIVGGVVWGVLNVRALAGTARTEGTVLSSSSMRSSGSHGVVGFTAPDGKKYTADITSTSIFHRYSRGDRVAVAYDPEDPSNARLADFTSTYLGPLVTAGFGALVAALLSWSWVSSRRNNRRLDWFREHGQEIRVPIAQTNVKENRPFKSGSATFVVEARWTDSTGQPRTAKSEYLTDDPRYMLTVQDGVTVRYDPADTARSIIDLENIPSAT